MVQFLLLQWMMKHHVPDSSYELLISIVDKWKFVFALFPLCAPPLGLK